MFKRPSLLQLMVLENFGKAGPEFFCNLQEEGTGKTIGQKRPDITILIITFPDRGFQAKGSKFVQDINTAVEILKENKDSDLSVTVEKIRESALFGYTEVAYFHQVRDAFIASLGDLLGNKFTAEEKQSWTSTAHDLAKTFSNMLNFGEIQISEI